MTIAPITIATLGAGVEYDTRDDRYLPRSGTRFLLDAERADRRLGSGADFVRVTAAIDHARPLGPFTFRASARGGYVRGVGGDEVPLAARFQHEGHADLAGYPYGSIGARDGFAHGFDGQGLGRAELELPIAYGISIAGFAGAEVDYTAGAMRALTVNTTAGVSIIWRSPIGPLRFDWAVPLDGPDHAPQFLFGLGSSW